MDKDELSEEELKNVWGTTRSTEELFEQENKNDSVWIGDNETNRNHIEIQTESKEELSDDDLEHAYGGAHTVEQLKNINEERPGSFYTEKIGKEETQALAETRTKGALARISNWFKNLFRSKNMEQENTKEER